MPEIDGRPSKLLEVKLLEVELDGQTHCQTDDSSNWCSTDGYWMADDGQKMVNLLLMSAKTDWSVTVNDGQDGW